MKLFLLIARAAGIAALLSFGAAGCGLASSAHTQTFMSDGAQAAKAMTAHASAAGGASANLVNSADRSMCIDADSNHYPSNGDNIQLWACNTHPEQEWTTGSVGSGSALTLGSWAGTAGPVAANKYYGYPYPAAPQCTFGAYKCVPDNWSFDQGQCTSWVAYRLNEMNHLAFNDSFRGVKWGNAGAWGGVARSLHFAVNGTPAVGSVAWYAPASGLLKYGHVAYVEKVNSPTSVVISEMNYDGRNGFAVHTITTSSGWPSGFIHLADR